MHSCAHFGEWKRHVSWLCQNKRISLEKQNHGLPALCKLEADWVLELLIGRELPWRVTQLSVDFLWLRPNFLVKEVKVQVKILPRMSVPYPDWYSSLRNISVCPNIWSSTRQAWGFIHIWSVLLRKHQKKSENMETADSSHLRIFFSF